MQSVLKSNVLHGRLQGKITYSRFKLEINQTHKTRQNNF